MSQARQSADHLPAIAGLYVVSSAEVVAPQVGMDAFADIFTACLSGGARVIQYRDKQQSVDTRSLKIERMAVLRDLCDDFNALLIVNDDIELADTVDADGVHLGTADDAVASARQRLGDGWIIGSSCYNQVNLAQSAVQAGANYVAFGCFFSSSTKPDAVQAELSLLDNARRQLPCPIVAIGGINANNARTVIDAGADAIAVIDAVFHDLTPALIEERCRVLSGFFRR